MPDIIVPSKDGKSFSAYLAMPEKTPAPGLIVIQEIFGVNTELRKKCDEFASKGFLAIAPDLFWRIEPNVQLTDKTETEWANAFDFFKKFDVDQGVIDLRDTLHTIKGHAACTGKVGAIGYCLGGKLAYLMATRSSVDCAVGYYAVGLPDVLGEASAIKSPLMLHIAEDDEYGPPEVQKAVKDGLQNNPLITLHSYPGAKHAFARGNGIHYKADAAQAAETRTLAFLKDALGAAKAA